MLLIFVIAAITVINQGGIRAAWAGDDPGDLLNYSFAVWAGSGVYRVKDANKRFVVLRAPFSYNLRSAQYDEPGFIDKLGFRLLLPAVVGIEEETKTDFTFGSAAFIPGLELQIPVNRYWTLKPFGQFGVGKDTADGDLKYIFGGGTRSLISFPWEKFVIGVGNSLILAKDRDVTSSESNGFSLLEAGLDIRHPLGLKLFNRDLDGGIFLVASRFFKRVHFLEDVGETERINLIYTAGLTVGFEKTVSIWKIDINRVGISYRWGNAGFRGIVFNMGFPF
jgi:hypothetical protein